MEIVIPTRNDWKCLETILKVLNNIDSINSVIIVDNNSDIQISRIIRKICSNFNFCRYLYCSKVGKGNAVRLGIKNTTEDVLFLDADIENISEDKILKLMMAFDSGFDLVKANFNRTNGQSNSYFIIRELQNIFPELNVNRPTGGIYLVRRNIQIGRAHV